MTTLERDIGYVRESIPILSDYLLSREIYWSLGASPPRGGQSYPQLTLGGVLLAMGRLRARVGQLVSLDDFRKYETEINQIKVKWYVAWKNKAAREFGARLKLWANFIDEYRSDPENHCYRYSYEVSRRVMLHLLETEADDLPEAEIELLRGLDGFLQTIFVEGEFIWDKDLERGFPHDSYWFLYGRIRG